MHFKASFFFFVLVALWLTRLGCSAALDFSGGRGRGAGGAEAVLRRVPHHRHAYVARRAHRAEGEQSAPFPPTPILPSSSRCSLSAAAVGRWSALSSISVQLQRDQSVRAPGRSWLVAGKINIS
jgi:hypothetical protein